MNVASRSTRSIGSWLLDSSVTFALVALALAGSRAHAQCPLIPATNTALFADTAAATANKTPLVNPPSMTGVTRTHVPLRKTVGVVNHNAGYCLYTPATPAQVRGVVLYMHGFQVGETGAYEAIVQQLAEYGYYVIYPYLDVVSLNVWPTLSKAALDNALPALQSASGVQNVVVAGFSMGGMAAARVGALYGSQQPPLKAVIMNDPASLDPLLFPTINSANDYNFDPDCLATIPCSARLLITESQQAHNTDSGAGPTLWNNIKQVPMQIGGDFRRNYLFVPNDISHAGTGTTPAQTTVASTHLDYAYWPYDYRDYYGLVLPDFGAIYQALTNTAFWTYSPYCNTSATTGLCAATRGRGSWRSDNVPATPHQNFADIVSTQQSVPPKYWLNSNFATQCTTQPTTLPAKCNVH